MKRILLLLIFTTTNITILAQVFEWARGLKGTTINTNYNKVDNSGNVITINRFPGAGTFDVDPGPGVYNLTANYNNDFYLLKSNAQGNFVWAQKTAETYTYVAIHSYNELTTDNFGNIYFTVQVVNAIMDVDPSPATYTVGGLGTSSRYIVKLNNAGNFMYATPLARMPLSENLKTDAFGNVFFTVYSDPSTIIDADVGPATFTVQGSHIVKIDAVGNFTWAKPIGGINWGNSPVVGSDSQDLMIDKNNNIYVAGTYSGTPDFDPGIGNYTMSAVAATGTTTTFDAFITKLDNAGNFVWAKSFTGSVDERIASVFVDSLSNVYATGYFNGTTDFDPGAGTYNLTSSAGNNQAFVGKLNPAGNFVWAKSFNNNGTAKGNNIIVDKTGNVITSGTYSASSIDFDPGAGTYTLSSISTGTTVSNNTFISVLDNNGNFKNIYTLKGADNRLADMDMDANNNLFLSGFSYTGADMDPGPNVYNFLTTEANNVNSNNYNYLLKLHNCNFKSSVAVTNTVACFGGNNGSASVLTPTTGTAPYSYNWLATPSQTTQIAGSLQAGSYSVVVTDAYGCKDTNDVTINQPNSALALLFTISSSSNKVKESCLGAGNGSYYCPPVTGGTPPYYFLWSTTPTQTTQTATNLTSGSYSVTVSDANGCYFTPGPTTPIQADIPNYNIAFNAIATTGNAPFFAGFSNATPNMANYNFTWYWGDGTFTSSNNINVTHTFANPGFYDVSLVATSIANGCADTLTKVGYMFIGGTAGCSQNVTLSPNSTVNTCSGSNVLLTASTNAAAGFTYQWNINSVPISGATSSTLSVNQSGYYSCTVLQSGCPVTSVPVHVVMNVNPPQPTISASGNILPCVGGTTNLTASYLSGVTYSWSTGQTSMSIVASTPGYYTVTSSYGNTSCSSSSVPFFLGTSLPSVPICMVSVDSLSTHNMVVWEKTGLPSSVDSFRVYRETMTNVFTKIGSLSINALSVFHDYNANPNVTSYKYKIAAVDSCGSTSSLSNYHQTIHLQYFGLGNLQWTLYDIEAAGNPVNYYVVYRDNFNTGNFIAISSTIPGGNSTYTDINYASFPNARYKVETAWNISCTPTAKLNNTNSGMIARSNIIQLGTTTSVPQIALQNELLIYPNPASTEITISTPIKFSDVKIVNSMGQIVQETKYNNTVSVVELSSGIYFVQLFNENGNLLKVKKFIKE